ncbi:Signal transduction histidine kinase [Lachnospiraceae bacterium C10]|nr:Signal transduction histidine kinase [Lachnospiraceae bacterium C10]
MGTRYSIQKKVITFITVVMILTAVILGGVVYAVIGRAQAFEAELSIKGLAETEASQLNQRFLKVETSVNDVTALADNTIASTNDVKDTSLRKYLTRQIKDVFYAIMRKNKQVIANYMTYDPELIGKSDGFFYVRNEQGELKENELTDIKKYQPDDLEHIGWYTIPKRNGKPVWLEPYYNKNIHRWLISYVVPFYKGKTLVAVIGMDIDFKALVDEVEQYRFYKHGMAFLKNKTGSVHYHPSFFDGDQHGDERIVPLHLKESTEHLKFYVENGVWQVGYSQTLNNGMVLFLCDTYNELYFERHVVLLIVVLATFLAAVILSIIMVTYTGRLIRPIMNLTATVKEIEQRNYDVEVTEEGEGEIRELTRGVGVMAKALRRQHLLTESELAERNRQLEGAIKEANRANAAKSEFLSQMSHDIRTPMNAIIGMCVIARDHLENPIKVKNCLDNIYSSSNYMLSLINDILDMSQIESGKLTYTESEFNLVALVNKCLVVLSSQIKNYQHHVSVDCSGLLHETVIVDGLRLQQVLVNLLSNSVKYTEKGGNIGIRVEEEQLSDKLSHYTFTVMDNGIGMTEEFQMRIFHPFTREKDDHQTEVKGTGLGMAITKAIVDHMGGQIEINSKLGEGTKISVGLNLETVDVARIKELKEQAEPVERSSENEEDGKILEGVRLLVVDDMIINLEIAATLLEEMGAIVETADNGKDAVEKFNLKPVGWYDAILMDIRMPIMDGYQATRAIRDMDSEYAKWIPIIAVSANAFEEDIRQSKEAGMNDHITKPIDVTCLRNILEQYFTGRSHPNDH